MGRSSAGGGGGGSRSSGHHSSSSRSFGGRSSSSRSSSSSYRTSSYSGGHSSYHRHYHTHRSYGGSGIYINGVDIRDMSPEQVTKEMFTLIYIFWVIALVSLLVASFVFWKNAPSFQREKLETSLCTETTYVVDDARWNVYDRDMDGMKYFYKKTGVQPIILIEDAVTYPESKLNDTELEAFLQEQYDSLCDDEGHALFMYWDDTRGNFEFYWLIGNRAKTVIDDEACDLVFKYFDNNATSNMSDDEFISKSFKSAANAIMKSPNSWMKIPCIGIPVLVVALVIIVFAHVSTRKKQLKVAEMQAASEILKQNTEDLKMD